jgi:CheY-like chemotaxis protein
MERGMTRPSVLVVEDEPLVAVHIGRIALEAGYELCGIAASGPEALALAEIRPPDVALIDIRLIGRMNGLEVARRLHGQFGTLPAFITADAPGLSPDLSGLPYVAIIGKPFSHEQLEDALAVARDILARKGAALETADVLG